MPKLQQQGFYLKKSVLLIIVQAHIIEKTERKKRHKISGNPTHDLLLIRLNRCATITSQFFKRGQTDQLKRCKSRLGRQDDMTHKVTSSNPGASKQKKFP